MAIEMTITINDAGQASVTSPVDDPPVTPVIQADGTYIEP